MWLCARSSHYRHWLTGIANIAFVYHLHLSRPKGSGPFPGGPCSTFLRKALKASHKQASRD